MTALCKNERRIEITVISWCDSITIRRITTKIGDFVSEKRNERAKQLDLILRSRRKDCKRNSSWPISFFSFLSTSSVTRVFLNCVGESKQPKVRQGSSLHLEDKFFFQHTQKQKVGDVSVEWPSSEIDWPQKGLLCCCRVPEKPSSETNKCTWFREKKKKKKHQQKVVT